MTTKIGATGTTVRRGKVRRARAASPDAASLPEDDGSPPKRVKVDRSGENGATAPGLRATRPQNVRMETVDRAVGVAAVHKEHGSRAVSSQGTKTRQIRVGPPPARIKLPALPAVTRRKAPVAICGTAPNDLPGVRLTEEGREVRAAPPEAATTGPREIGPLHRRVPTGDEAAGAPNRENSRVRFHRDAWTDSVRFPIHRM
jgi:hypothetical protein